MLLWRGTCSQTVVVYDSASGLRRDETWLPPPVPACTRSRLYKDTVRPQFCSPTARLVASAFLGPARARRRVGRGRGQGPDSSTEPLASYQGNPVVSPDVTEAGRVPRDHSTTRPLLHLLHILHSPPGPNCPAARVSKTYTVNNRPDVMHHHPLSAASGDTMAPQPGQDISELGEVAQPAEHQASSPPPLDDLDPFSRPATREPSLPPQPAVSWDAQTQSFAKRKRSTASQIFSDSSDPAIFSSDDDPALDNYVQGRHKKKRYVGSWFQQRPASSDSGLSLRHGSSARHGSRSRSRSKRPFVPVDSGVFMGSDSSTDDILEELPPARANNMVLPPATTTRPPAPQLIQVPRLSQKGKLSEAEAKAQEVIRQCIDRGIEAVDLS